MSTFPDILVLGASGFVGSHVIRHFKNEGIACVPSSKTQGVDLRDYDQTLQLLKKTRPDVIINCAAHVGSLNYVTDHAANIILDNSRMILNLYEAISHTNPNTLVINPLANCAYPAKADTFKEDNWWDGHLHRSVLSYGSTRRLLWSVGESFSMQFGIRSIYLLVPNMYGEFDSTNPDKAHALNALISKFVKADKEHKKEIHVWGTGLAIREWLYAGDFARILVQILKTPHMVGLTEPVNIAQNFGLSVKELVYLINACFDNKFEIRWDHSMPDGAPKKVMDDTRFKKVFSEFKFSSFQEGVNKTIAYYQSIYPY